MSFAYYSQKAYDTPEQLILGERQYTHERQPGIKPDCIYHCRCFFFIVVLFDPPQRYDALILTAWMSTIQEL
jgi:hypothetical protein